LAGPAAIPAWNFLSRRLPLLPPHSNPNQATRNTPEIGGCLVAGSVGEQLSMISGPLFRRLPRILRPRRAEGQKLQQQGVKVKVVLVPSEHAVATRTTKRKMKEKKKELAAILTPPKSGRAVPIILLGPPPAARPPPKVGVKEKGGAEVEDGDADASSTAIRVTVLIFCTFIFLNK
jgi:hypothetical protein